MTVTTTPARVFCDLTPHADDDIGPVGYDVTFTNHDDEPFTCDHLTLTLSHNGDGSPLAADSVVFHGQEDTGTAAWGIGTDGGPTRFTATPCPSRRTIPGGGSITFGLTFPESADDLRVTTTVTGSLVGRSTMTSSENHVLVPPADDRVIDNLKASDAQVQRGMPVTLTWNDAPGPGMPSYTLEWAVKGKRTKKPLSKDDHPRFQRKEDTGWCSFLTHKLDEQTVFVLTAERSPKTQTQAVLVTVAEGDLRVGELTVNGTARLFGTPQKLFPEKLPSVSAGQRLSWDTTAAPTSGLLLATLRTDSAADSSRKATLTVITASSAAPHTISLPMGRESHLTAVLRDGDQAEITVEAENAGPSAVLYVTWFPFGCLSAQGQGRLGVKTRT
ncbi:hypothetical protein AB0H73_10915 [Streptomyces olivoreticuli]